MVIGEEALNRPLRRVFPFLTSYYGNGGTKFSKKTERRLSLHSSNPRSTAALRALRRVSRMHTNNDLPKSNAPFPSKRRIFKISFESRPCCNVREQVAKGSTVREKRARSCVQCKVERFDLVE